MPMTANNKQSQDDPLHKRIQQLGPTAKKFKADTEKLKNKIAFRLQETLKKQELLEKKEKENEPGNFCNFH